MALVLKIVGGVVTLLSGSVLWIMVGALYRAQRRLNEAGINEPIPLRAGPRLVILGWSVALLIGLALIFLTN